MLGRCQFAAKLSVELEQESDEKGLTGSPDDELGVLGKPPVSCEGCLEKNIPVRAKCNLVSTRTTGKTPLGRNMNTNLLSSTFVCFTFRLLRARAGDLEIFFQHQEVLDLGAGTQQL